MKDSHARQNGDRDSIFSSPIRTLTADELESVAGGDDTGNTFGSKLAGGVDNHSKEMD